MRKNLSSEPLNCLFLRAFKNHPTKVSPENARWALPRIGEGPCWGGSGQDLASSTRLFGERRLTGTPGVSCLPIEADSSYSASSWSSYDWENILVLAIDRGGIESNLWCWLRISNDAVTHIDKKGKGQTFSLMFFDMGQMWNELISSIRERRLVKYLVQWEWYFLLHHKSWIR